MVNIDMTGIIITITSKYTQMVLRTRKSVLELVYISQTLKYRSQKGRLINYAVYAAEMLAVIIGLQWVEEVRPDRVVMCD